MSYFFYYIKKPVNKGSKFSFIPTSASNGAALLLGEFLGLKDMKKLLIGNIKKDQ